MWSFKGKSFGANIGKTADIIDGVETIRIQANNIEFEVDAQREGET